MEEFITVSVSDLPSDVFDLSDFIPHDKYGVLKKGTIQELANTIGNYLGTSNGLAFNPTTVASGSTLPATTINEWMLVGKGTFQNVGGGASVTTTEELNAVTSNGSFWSLSVQIPINVELAGITQNIRSGYTQTTPSEDAVFRKINEIVSDIPDKTIIKSKRFAGIAQTYTLPAGSIAFQAYINEAIQFPEDADFLNDTNTFTQSADIVTFLKPIIAGQRIRINYFY